MSQVTVVLCPALDPGAAEGGRRELAATLAGWGIPVLMPRLQPRPIPDRGDETLAIAAWVADQAVAITSAQVHGPLVIVSTGAANSCVPALGFAQRASRHNVVAYVLIDGPLPDPVRAGSDWPDAPVVYVNSTGVADESSRAARLRGWTALEADPISAVTTIARGWPDTLT